ncbi:hypothetical protein [Peribacillus simplex]|uniref:hypothetical protein n=1 Tax=Peribacillus simplex TaxID=1478 RepID=UPI003D26D3F0
MKPTMMAMIGFPIKSIQSFNIESSPNTQAPINIQKTGIEVVIKVMPKPVSTRLCLLDNCSAIPSGACTSILLDMQEPKTGQLTGESRFSKGMNPFFLQPYKQLESVKRPNFEAYGHPYLKGNDHHRPMDFLFTELIQKGIRNPLCTARPDHHLSKHGT